MKQLVSCAQTLVGLCLATVMVGCGHVKIQDPAVIEAAGAVGRTSASLVDARTAGGPDTVEGRAVAVESALVALALAHDTWVTVPGQIHDLVEVPEPDGSLRWSNGRLRGGLVLEDGGRMVGNLRFMGGRTESVSGPGSVDGVCQQAEVSGSGDSVWCPPVVDRMIRLERPVVVDGVAMSLRLGAEYGLRLDGRGCAAGGQVEVLYVLTPETDQPVRGGFVSANFAGCHRASASTIEK